MEKVIQIGAKEIKMTSNAATPVRYRNTFGEDLLTILTKGTTKAGVDMSVASDVAPKLAFIMAKSADKADMNGLSDEMFISWLEQFEAMDIMNATEDIFSVYFGDSATNVESKKKAEDKLKGN